MVDISFLIPTKRPWNSFGKVVVDGIVASHENRNPDKYSYEILVYSVNKIDDPRIKWIKENKMVGGAAACNALAAQSNGRYMSFFVDDCHMPKSIFNTIDFLRGPAFASRKYKICTLPTSMDPETPRHMAWSETKPTLIVDKLKKLGVSMNLPLFMVMCLPVCSRETYEALGKVIHHPQIHYFPDVYLGYWLYANGEPGIQWTGNGLEHFGNHDTSSETEIKFDKIFGHLSPPWQGISYVNLYRIIKNYKPGMPYIYKIEEWDEDKVLAMLPKSSSSSSSRSSSSRSSSSSNAKTKS